MKVIKIRKTYRNGDINLYMFLEDWQCYNKSDNSIWTENIDIHADDRCAEDSGGHNYGWNFSWEILTDFSEIEKVVLEEIERKKKSIEWIQKKIDNLFTIIQNNEQDGK